MFSVLQYVNTTAGINYSRYIHFIDTFLHYIFIYILDIRPVVDGRIVKTFNPDIKNYLLFFGLHCLALLGLELKTYRVKK